MTTEQKITFAMAMLAVNQRGKDNKDMTCPRCGKTMHGKATTNALSRYYNVYICSDCGTEEALMDFYSHKSKPIEDWYVAKVLESVK